MQNNNNFEEVGMIETGHKIDDKPEPKTVNNPVTELNSTARTILND